MLISEANCDINSQNNFGMSPLIVSVQHGMDNMATLLLQQKANLALVISTYLLHVQIILFKVDSNLLHHLTENLAHLQQFTINFQPTQELTRPWPEVSLN